MPFLILIFIGCIFTCHFCPCFRAVHSYLGVYFYLWFCRIYSISKCASILFYLSFYCSISILYFSACFLWFIHVPFFYLFLCRMFVFVCVFLSLFLLLCTHISILCFCVFSIVMFRCIILICLSRIMFIFRNVCIHDR